MCTTPAPTVSALWRYPVKSMGGQPLEQAELTSDGLAGDREWGVVDLATGLTASAKHPARFGRLLDCGARIDGDGPPVVTLPDGRELRAGDAATDTALSALLGRAVALRRASEAPDRISRTDPVEGGVDRRVEPAGRGADGPIPLAPPTTGTLGAATPGHGRLVDHAPLHVVTTATLDGLAGRLPGDGADVRRFRPNLVLAVDAAAFVEDGWVGRRLGIGSSVLTVEIPTPRCVVPTLPQPGLRRSPETLRVVAATNRPEIPGVGRRPGAGVYALVVRAGRLAVGDVVALDPGAVDGR